MKHIIFVIAFLVGSSSLMAQSKFQGTVKYSWNISGEGVEAFQFMMPTGSTLITSKHGSRLIIEGGMMSEMMGEIAYNAKSKKSFQLKVDAKTASELPADEAPTGPEPTITKEDEVIEILGYSCQKYRVESMQNGAETTQYVWTTDAFSIYDSGKNASISMGTSTKLEGFPMKIVVTEGPVTMEMLVTELTPGKPSKALFSVPKDYTMEPYDPSGMGM